MVRIIKCLKHTEVGPTLHSELSDSINLFLLHTFQIQNTNKVESCELFQGKKYFSANTLPPSALPVTRVTHKVTFIF
jgi:hypothetical protein